MITKTNNTNTTGTLSVAEQMQALVREQETVAIKAQHSFTEGTFIGTFNGIETILDSGFPAYVFSMTVEGVMYTRLFSTKPADTSDLSKAVARFQMLQKQFALLGEQLSGKPEMAIAELNDYVGKSCTVYCYKTDSNYLDVQFTAKLKATPITEIKTEVVKF